MGGDHDLVPRTDIQRAQGQRERVKAVADTQRTTGLAKCSEFSLERPQFRAKDPLARLHDPRVSGIKAGPQNGVLGCQVGEWDGVLRPWRSVRCIATDCALTARFRSAGQAAIRCETDWRVRRQTAP